MYLCVCAGRWRTTSWRSWRTARCSCPRCTRCEFLSATITLIITTIHAISIKLGATQSEL